MSKKIVSLIFTILVLFSQFNIVLAVSENQTPVERLENALPVIGFAINTLQILGAGAATVVLAIFGVKWFFGGSAQKAALKSKIGTYILAVTILVAGPLLVKIIVDLIVIAFPQ